MQAVFQRHLNEPVAVNIDGNKPTQVTLLHSKPDYFTVDTHAGGWAHVPYSSVVTVLEWVDVE